MPDEGELALGIMARVCLAFFDGLFQTRAAFPIGDQAGHTMGTHDRQSGIKLARGKAFHFLHRAGLHHHLKTRIDAGVKSLAFRGEEDAKTLRGIK